MPKPPPNLNLLRSLDVLLATCNLTAAATILGLTQSTLSRQLAQLRSQFGDPLLVREGQRFLLTQRAQALRGPLKSLLDSLQTVLSEPVFDAATCERHFTVAGSDYLAEHMLPALVQAIGQQAPRAALTFRMWEPGYYRLLSDEGVDLVATIADVLPDNLHGRAMGEDRPVCAMRPAHPLARQTMTLADYAGWPHLRVTGGSDKDGFVDDCLAVHGLRRQVRVAVPFFSSALRIVAADDLLWTLPEHMAVKLARQAPLVWQPLPADLLPRAAPHSPSHSTSHSPSHSPSQPPSHSPPHPLAYRYWLLWHARSHHDPVHAWFRQQVFTVLHAFDHGVTQFATQSGMQDAHGNHAHPAIVGLATGP